MICLFLVGRISLVVYRFIRWLFLQPNRNKTCSTQWFAMLAHVHSNRKNKMASKWKYSYLFNVPCECVLQRKQAASIWFQGKVQPKITTVYKSCYVAPAFYSSSLYGYSSGTCLSSLTCNSNASSPRSISRIQLISVFIDTWPWNQHKHNSGVRQDKEKIHVYFYDIKVAFPPAFNFFGFLGTLEPPTKTHATARK